ncbi:MAG: HAD family hydrolase [Prevotellaceae bacterium]|jgi:D-glycero-D-manno-heptose 1,7-bisphosphate phosphatase|nr:HAD family hydrolase [Prevotellaceae bacterium]
MQKAVFLDRDGVINSDEGRYYVYREEDFVLTPHLAENLKLLQEAGFLLIVVSNQGGVARGLYGVLEVERLNSLLREQVAKYGVALAELYVCPHHPDFGKCLCRKPLPLLVQKALARFDIDASRSYFVGDRESDMETARNAGVKGILVNRNAGIAEAVKEILAAWLLA